MADAAAADAVVPTADGSATLRSARYGETYHSIHGAARESREVYLAASGVLARLDAGQPARVLEIGFGLGLNFLLSADHARARNARLDYHACEHDPVAVDTLRTLGYEDLLAERDVLDVLLAALAQPAPRHPTCRRPVPPVRGAPGRRVRTPCSRHSGSRSGTCR